MVDESTRSVNSKATHSSSATATSGAKDEPKREGDRKMVRKSRASRRLALLVAALAVLSFPKRAGAAHSPAEQRGVRRDGQHWIGTWATAPQAAIPGHAQTFRHQTLRLIVHVSAGGRTLRIRISNTFGDQPLLIGGAHVARRTEGADSLPRPSRRMRWW